MICAIRNIALAVIVLASAASAQQETATSDSAQKASKTKPAPCSAVSTSSSGAATRAPDLSDAAKKACDPKKGEFWDEHKGCMWIVDWDFGSEPIGIDPQSSTVQHTLTDHELNRLPTSRSVGDVISMY